MMEQSNSTQKITAGHLRRSAYLYVRQSTAHQVAANTESTERQYALQQRAVTFGWGTEQIVVIDDDQGKSGSSVAGRDGFQRLVADVGMARVGVVMGLEVSRLARNSADWHRLLEICAVTETLILDEEGLYNPAAFNDRLLLGLKGTMSEAELHVLKARMRGGLLNKARRAELTIRLPVGLVSDEDGKVLLDPDQQVQDAVRLLFQTFRRLGSAFQTVRYYYEHHLLFPKRTVVGPDKGELLWTPLTHQRVLQVLRNPRYAGAFVYGRSRTRRRPDAVVERKELPRADWCVLVPDAHEGYITWEQYEQHEQTLSRNRSNKSRVGPAREGPALLQGLVVCGRCGQGMTVHYRKRCGPPAPVYLCNVRQWKVGAPCCQTIIGTAVDDAVGKLIVATFTPVAIEAALAVQDELHARVEEVDRFRFKQVERARHEADLARRRYMQVDPDNRLVADTLETAWNKKLQAHAAAHEEYEQQRARDRVVLDQQMRDRVRALAVDFPRVWADPKTPHRERKRLARLLIEDVTLTRKSETIHIGLRFKTGATKVLSVPRPPKRGENTQTSREVVAEIDRLLNEHTPAAIASRLNATGARSGAGKPFRASMVCYIIRSYGLKTRLQRLQDAGMLTEAEIAARLGLSRTSIQIKRRRGILPGAYRPIRVDDRGIYVYEALSQHKSTLNGGAV